MNRSTDRILTTHTGKLLMPGGGFVEAGSPPTPPERVREEITAFVAKQAEIGMDVISNGEPAGIGPRTVFSSVEGIENVADIPESTPFIDRIPWVTRDMLEQRDFYSSLYERPGRAGRFDARRVVTGPLKLSSLEPFERDIQTFKEVLAEHAPDREAFYCVVAPAWLEQFVWNEYYDSGDDFVVALSEVMTPIFKTVTDNGLILQIDDPAISKSRDEARRPLMSDAEFERFLMVRIEALNAALEGISEEMVRYHLCWGSGRGMHTDQQPLRNFAPMMLKVKAQAFSIESAKSPHRLEWRVWRDDLRWPEDKIIIPGVVDHTTNVVEPAELIADSLVRFANVCGRENVMAGTDCGMRGNAEANWMKYENIVRGAELATSQLW